MCVPEWCFGFFCLCTVKKDFILSALIIADISEQHITSKHELVLLPVYNFYWHQVASSEIRLFDCSYHVPGFNFCLVKQIQDEQEKTADISQCHFLCHFLAVFLIG